MLDQFPLSRKQVRSIVESRDVRIAAWTGAVRSGKTISALVSFLITIAAAPPTGLVIMSGRTLQTIERNLIEPLQDPALFGPVSGQVHHTRGSSTATILGRTVHLIGAADARAEGKLRGLTAYAILLDECSLLPEEYMAQALARCSVPGSRLLLTTNPAGPRHWLRMKYLLRASELDLGHWHFTLDDNPFLDPAYVASLKAELTGIWYQRMILGRWVAGEGAIYEMFDPARHVVRGSAPVLRLLPGLGVDVGSVNPFHAVMLGVTTDGRLCASREYRHDPAVTQRQLTDAEFSKTLTAWIGIDRPHWIAVDPSAASFKLQLYRDGHHNVVDADNSVLDGIRMVASLFATNSLVIHESCRALLDEIPGYGWDATAALKGEDKPMKVDDHGCDGLRYGVKTTENVWRPYLKRITQVA